MVNNPHPIVPTDLQKQAKDLKLQVREKHYFSGGPDHKEFAKLIKDIKRTVALTNESNEHQNAGINLENLLTKVVDPTDGKLKWIP